MMIILAIGMPRAGSGWHYNLTHDLMMTAGATDAREIRRRYRLGSILTEVNCNIGALTLRRLLMVMIPSILGQTFTIKVHAGPTPFAKTLIRRGAIRPTYIYRDPRDALLSAYEYGRRAVDKGSPNAFSHLDTIKKAIDFMTEYVRDWEDWMAVRNLHPVQYELLKTDYDSQAENLASFLQIDSKDPGAVRVIRQYAPKESTGQKGLHFHKGVSGRFREALTQEQQEASWAAFQPVIEKMGYERIGNR
jgi:hypothetical protein